MGEEVNSIVYRWGMPPGLATTATAVVLLAIHLWRPPAIRPSLALFVFLIGLVIYQHSGSADLSATRPPLEKIAASLFLASCCLYIFLCASLINGWANRLTRWRGEKWIKELDYIYLSLGALGAFGTLNRIPLFPDRYEHLEIYAPLVLSSAVVVRLVKTRAEIGNWNKF